MGISPTVRHFDLFQSISASVINVFNRRPTPTVRLVDCLALRLFVRYTFWILLGGYVAITFSWWGMDILHCINKFNAELPMKAEHINICASYLFVRVEDSVMGGRKYLLFYKWVHYVLLIISLLFYIPHKIGKKFENLKLCRLLYHISHSKGEGVVYKDSCDYFNKNCGSHNLLFIKYLAVNIIALGTNVACFFIIDFVFLGNFKDLGYATYPFRRDIVNFQDELSLRFPPFAECELTEFHKLTNKRIERYGCHLLYMELFEKYFIILWAWMIFTTVYSLLYILYICLILVPSQRPRFLFYPKPISAKREEIFSIDESLTRISYGDFFLLLTMRSYFPPDSFYLMLKTLFYKPQDSKSHIEIVMNRQVSQQVAPNPVR